MLPRFLISIFLFLVFLNGADDNKYLCPLDPQYPEFLAGNIKLEQMKNYADRELCKKECISQNTCLLSKGEPKTTKVFSFINGKIEEGGLDYSKAILRKTKFAGIKITNANGVEVYSASGDQNLIKTILFEEILNSELKKSGVKGSVKSDSLNIEFYDGSVSYVAKKDKGVKTKGGITEKSVELTHDPNGEKITVVSGKDGKTKKQGWITYNQILAEIGVHVNGKTLNLDELKQASETSTEFIPITISANGEVNFLMDSVIIKTNEMKFGEAKVTFISHGLLDSEGEKTLSYWVETEGGTGGKNFFNNDYRISLVQKEETPHYYCGIKSDLKGDLGDNKFRNEENCNKVCQVNQECFSQDEGEGLELGKGCRIVESVLLDPITTSKGETVYMGKRITTECEVKEKQQTGCALWETKFVEGPDFGNDPLALREKYNFVETKKQNHDFSKALGVFGQMNALESAGKIFSGESNWCEYGTWFDEPNWGMLAAKYAMAIGGPFIGGGLSGAGDSLAEAAKEAGTSSFKMFWTAGGREAMNAGFKAGIEAVSASITATTKIVENIMSNLFLNVAILEISLAVEAAENMKDEEKNAIREQDKANQLAQSSGGAFTGDISDQDADKTAREYAECMTKHGLSYHIIASWQMGIETSDEFGNTSFLDESWNHPLKFSPLDVVLLKKVMENKSATSVKDLDAYFYARYRLEKATQSGEGNVKDDVIWVYPLTAQDRIIAAETQCGGKDKVLIIREKYGKRFLDPEYLKPTPERLMEEISPPPPPPSALPDEGDKEDTGDGQKDTFTPKKIATTVINAINSAVPFPYNLIAMVAMDLLDMFDWGNLCNDLDKAEERADKESIKTNKRKSDGLCVYTQTDVVWWVGNEKARERDYYCCYDTHSTKAFAQGVIQQHGLRLGKDNCSPITLEHLKSSSFSPCKAGQDPKRDKCFPKNHFKELQDAYIQGASIGVGEMVESILNNMFKLENAVSDDGKKNQNPPKK